jgi:hypothetical protein
MPEAEDTYPQILSNVNVKAQIVWSAEQKALYGSDWVELDLAAQGLALTPAPPAP